MEKLLIKVTVYRGTDPDLYDSLVGLPLRQRSTVIRKLWRKGLEAGHLAQAGLSETANPPAPGSSRARDAEELLGLIAFG